MIAAMIVAASLLFASVAGGTSPADGQGGGDPAPEKEREMNAKRIPCPFLSGMYRQGILKPDSIGRISSDHMKNVMVAAGSTLPNAIFPALGTVRFRQDDVHQRRGRHFDYGLLPESVLQELFPGMGFQEKMWLNIMTMNVGDKCVNASDAAYMPSKFPCNANPQHVQHGYSTTIRDTRYDAEDPTREKRFQSWIGQVLVEDKACHPSERVMKFDGFARMLKRMATEGDQSSEWSLLGNELQIDGSNSEKYHPSLNANQARALYNWGAYLAWVGLWEAFGHSHPDTTEGKYMTESDLRSFFLDGNMPKRWKPQKFTLEDVGFTIIALKGRGIPTGDLWSDALETNFPLSKWIPGQFAKEWRYMVNYATTQRKLGFFKDDILNPIPNTAFQEMVFVV